MRLFKRSQESAPSAVESFIDWATRRRQPLACAGCKKVKQPYVYTENDKEYCLDCAKTNLMVLRLYPAGKRADDIKLQDLLIDNEELLKRMIAPQPSTENDDKAPQADNKAS